MKPRCLRFKSRRQPICGAGVKSFIVSHTGVVYEKDLGPETLEAFQKMELFNPDDSWHPTEDEW